MVLFTWVIHSLVIGTWVITNTFATTPGRNFECVAVAGDDHGQIFQISLTDEKVRIDLSEDCIGHREIDRRPGGLMPALVTYEHFGACGSKDGTSQLIVERAMTHSGSSGKVTFLSRGEAPFQSEYYCKARP